MLSTKLARSRKQSNSSFGRYLLHRVTPIPCGRLALASVILAGLLLQSATIVAREQSRRGINEAISCTTSQTRCSIKVGPWRPFVSIAGYLGARLHTCSPEEMQLLQSAELTRHSSGPPTAAAEFQR